VKPEIFLTAIQKAVLLSLLMMAALQLYPMGAFAQNPNPGTAPQFKKAVPGQEATQPEGTVLNIVNWIGNVISPLLAVGCIVMAVISYSAGRGAMRWVVTAIGLLMISGLTRLIEAWINSGTGGV
jgi:hypothetical protein